MRLSGKVWKDKRSKYWVIEVADLNLSTQGTSKEDAFEMIKDAIEGLVNEKNFAVTIFPGDDGEFTVSGSYSGALIALLLRRQRSAAGLTSRQAAKSLGSTSPNAYAQYERGDRIPTMQKLEELIRAVNPEKEPILLLGKIH